ncbi:hypothetical protein BJY01DRAFT_252648 [Aspergillus pseudoustus]|uniref:Uncharacterized protein n=1 Tax=Aspergillus pseudoustus TaxID=1810923 RepID=A0ABR4J8V5_9EURO
MPRRRNSKTTENTENTKDTPKTEDPPETGATPTTEGTPEEKDSPKTTDLSNTDDTPMAKDKSNDKDTGNNDEDTPDDEDARLARYADTSRLNIHYLQHSDPTILVYDLSGEAQGLSWDIPPDGLVIAIIGPRAAALIPVPKAPLIIVHQNKRDILGFDDHLKMVLHSVKPFIERYRSTWWPLSEPFRVVGISRCKALAMVDWRPIVEAFLGECGLTEGDSDAFGLSPPTLSPSVLPSQRASFAIHENQCHLFVSLQTDRDHRSSWFVGRFGRYGPTGVDTTGNRPRCVFRMQRAWPPPEYNIDEIFGTSVEHEMRRRERHFFRGHEIEQANYETLYFPGSVEFVSMTGTIFSE